MAGVNIEWSIYYELQKTKNKNKNVENQLIENFIRLMKYFTTEYENVISLN